MGPHVLIADLYRVGVCVPRVPDQALHDSLYQERNMSPPENEDYAAASGIPFADALRCRAARSACVGGSVQAGDGPNSRSSIASGEGNGAC